MNIIFFNTQKALLKRNGLHTEYRYMYMCAVLNKALLQFCQKNVNSIREQAYNNYDYSHFDAYLS